MCFKPILPLCEMQHRHQLTYTNVCLNVKYLYCSFYFIVSIGRQYTGWCSIWMGSVRNANVQYKSYGEYEFESLSLFYFYFFLHPACSVSSFLLFFQDIIFFRFSSSTRIWLFLTVFFSSVPLFSIDMFYSK